LNGLLYGDHPYGQQPEVAELQALTREDVTTYYNQQLDPEQAFLVVVGDIASEEAVQLAEETFDDWTASATATEEQIAYPEPPERNEQQIYLVDSPGATQASIALGHLLPADISEDRFALIVADQVLGAGSSSRLMQNLRQEQGFTYAIYSYFTSPRDQGGLYIQTSVRNEVVEAALAAIIDELQRLRTEPVPTTELQGVKDYLIGNFALQTETAEAVALRLLGLKLDGLPLRDLEEYPQNIAEVTQTEVRQAAQQYIHPDEIAIVVVGDASQIQSELEAVAPVTLIE
jgi:predicted Zn-dependent peptidase